MTGALRKEFEEDLATSPIAPWAKDTSWDEASGSYLCEYVNFMWIGWQRARAALTIKLPPAPLWPDPADHDDMDIDELEKAEAAVGAEMGMLNRCREAIRSKGVKVK